MWCWAWPMCASSAPVRGLLENPQGATRLSGRDDVQKNQGDARSRKQQKAAQRAAKQKVEEAPAVEEAPKKRGLFGNGFRLPKKQEAEPVEAKTSDKDSTK